MINKLIKIIESCTDLEVKPLFTDKIEECITYTEQTTADDGVKARHRLELRLITFTLAKAEDVKKKLISALVNVGDEMEIEGIYNSNMNGGGVLFDEGTQTVHTIIYFEYLTRSNKQ